MCWSAVKKLTAHSLTVMVCGGREDLLCASVHLVDENVGSMCSGCPSVCSCVPGRWRVLTGSPPTLVIFSSRHGTRSLGLRVNESFGSSFTSGSLGHRVIILTRCEPEFFRFSTKYPKCKTYIWNAEMTEVIVKCLLLDWNHWMSVHAMKFYFCLWLLKILQPENTFSWRQWRHCSIL